MSFCDAFIRAGVFQLRNGAAEWTPGASPQAGGVVDGAELARRMMMATEAASAATEMAARVLEELKTASERSSENRDW